MKFFAASDKPLMLPAYDTRYSAARVKAGSIVNKEMSPPARRPIYDVNILFMMRDVNVNGLVIRVR